MSDFKSVVKSKSVIATSEKARVVQDIQTAVADSNVFSSLAMRSFLPFVGVSSRKKAEQKFAEQVVKTANSDEVRDELIATIGKPREHETEEEFVERGKAALRRILKRKFNSK